MQNLQQPETIKIILAYIKANSDRLKYNENIFEILEGDLLTTISKSLRQQLSEQSANEAIQRAAPINVLKKVVDKLSGLYKEAPTRMTESESDLELITNYTLKQSINAYFQDANEGFNSYKYSCIEMFFANQEINFRVIPSHQFLPYSDDPIDPLKVTAMIKFMGDYVTETGKKTQRIHVYTDEEFVSITLDGDVVKEDMENNEGINPFGVIPFSYVARSRYLLVPIKDTDTLTMTVLFPVLLTDMNFSMKYMSNPIVYGVDIDGEDLKRNPNIFWNLKSTVDGKAPTVGVLKPESDLEGMLNVIKEQMVTWLESKNIKAGAIGVVTSDNAQSGIAMMLREMDTTNDMKKQSIFFQQFENDFWYKLSIIHNTLSESGQLKERTKFSKDGIEVSIRYSDFKPIEDRLEKVKRLKLEVDSGFYSKKRAIQDLNPFMEPKEIEEIIKELEDEKEVIEIFED